VEDDSVYEVERIVDARKRNVSNPYPLYNVLMCSKLGENGVFSTMEGL
jgi:hypothetical protein